MSAWPNSETRVYDLAEHVERIRAISPLPECCATCAHSGPGWENEFHCERRGYYHTFSCGEVSVYELEVGPLDICDLYERGEYWAAYKVKEKNR